MLELVVVVRTALSRRRRQPRREGRAARAADLVPAAVEERRLVRRAPLIIQLQVLVVENREIGLEVVGIGRSRGCARFEEADDADADRVAVGGAPEPRLILLDRSARL